ncbi:chromatin assembly factor 1 subunit A [Ctenodactylus gundi]
MQPRPISARAVWVTAVPAKYERGGTGRGGTGGRASDRPPKLSSLLCRLSGARAAAAAMLEELECGAPGARGPAAAVDCKDRPVFPGKKLIQARLPFKRLNLLPKEKAGDGVDDQSPQNTSAEGSILDTETSYDLLESDCHLGSDLDLRPKLVNGKGPIDPFLQGDLQASLGQATVIIDLTEDSNNSTVDQDTLNPPAPCSGEAINGITELQGSQEATQNDTVALPVETYSDSPGNPEEEHADSVGPNWSVSPQDRFLHKEQGGWSEARGFLFRGKVPVVVLQDILPGTHTPTQARSPPETPVDKNETSESDDSVLSHSSLSSSPTSSPEGPPERQPGSGRPSAAPTPVRRDKEQLKEQKERLKEEARRAREAARKRKEEEKELRERERREKREKDEKEKAEKQRCREQRRRERREALEAKLEEKRKKEEEKRLREEEKRIKAEKAEITRFFQKPKMPQAPKTLAGSCGKFAPFEIKEHMVLAPRCRASLGQDLCDQLDHLLQQQSGDFSFLQDLKGRRPLRSGPTKVCGQVAEAVNSNLVVVGSSKANGGPERKRFGRMKLLQFCENHRPAYWGTWKKTTRVIRPRDPWAQDRKLLDYEVDSDEEWEEEEPGESLSHSEGDDDDDVGEDEDDDDGFFVPHGYLSEDEGVTEECADPEKHKVRQKLKAKEWDDFLAKGKRVRILQPVSIGCVWAGAGSSDGDAGDGDSTGCTAADLKVLQQFTACLLEPTSSEDEPTPKASKREKRDQLILAQLLPLLHGNVNGSKAIIREFQEQCRLGLLRGHEPASPPSLTTDAPRPPAPPEDAAVPSKARLKRLISENSVYEKRPDFRMCWYVHPQVLQSFAQEHLPVPCQWSYVTTVPSAPREDGGGGGTPVVGPSQAPPMSLKRKSAGSMCITQFMKKRRHEAQAGAGDMDGFQADTEEEEEEDGDCMIVDLPDVGGAQDVCAATLEAEGTVGLDISETLLPTSPLGAS